MGSSYEVLYGDSLEVKNNHPTVKSIALMRWLCRLVTPKGGKVLDPFCGSGSTGCACMYEGFSFIGIDKDEVYCNIARKRIEYHIERSKLPQQKQRVYVVNRPKNSMLGSLFEEGDV